MNKFIKRKLEDDVACTSTGSSEDSAKSKTRRYDEPYLNFGFISLEVGGEGKLLCVNISCDFFGETLRLFKKQLKLP